MAGTRRKKQIGTQHRSYFTVSGEQPTFKGVPPRLADIKASTKGTKFTYADRRLGPADRREKDLGYKARTVKKPGGKKRK